MTPLLGRLILLVDGGSTRTTTCGARRLLLSLLVTTTTCAGLVGVVADLLPTDPAGKTQLNSHLHRPVS